MHKSLTQRHIDLLKTIYGETQSFHRPYTMERRIHLYNRLLEIPSRFDAEHVVDALKEYIGWATGRKIRITTAFRKIFLHLYALRHQYGKGPVAFSSYLAGRDHSDSVIRLRRILEEAGLIRLVAGKWAYNPKIKKVNRAPSYLFADDFVMLLELFHCSVEQGRKTSYYLVEARRDTSGRIHPVPCTPYFNYNKNKQGVVHSACEGYGSYTAVSALCQNKVTKPTRQRDRTMRDRKLAKLWGGMSVDTMKENGLYENAVLTSHSVAIGLECDDLAITQAIEERYRLPEYAALAARVDSHLPFMLNGITLRQGYRVNIQRDNDGNITKIGCRPNSGMCQTHNEKHEELYGIAAEKDARSNIVGELMLPWHYDVPCSIYNLSIALETGVYEPKDIYSAIAERLGVSRGLAKICLMKANFGIFAEQCSCHPDGQKAATKMSVPDPETGETVRLPFTYRDVQGAMRDLGIPIQGRSTEIFVHEAWIYDLVRLYLLKDEVMPSTRVYDSFYTRYPVKEKEFTKLINRAIRDYQNIRARNDAALSIRL